MLNIGLDFNQPSVASMLPQGNFIVPMEFEFDPSLHFWVINIFLAADRPESNS